MRASVFVVRCSLSTAVPVDTPGIAFRGAHRRMARVRGWRAVGGPAARWARRRCFPPSGVTTATGGPGARPIAWGENNTSGRAVTVPMVESVGYEGRDIDEFVADLV